MDYQFSDAIEMSKADYEIDSLDLEYIIESIENQLDNLLIDITKKNYLKKFIDKYNKLTNECPDKSDELEDQRNTLYDHIIRYINDKFDIEIDTDYVDNMDKFIKTLYKFFIIEYMENVSMFVEMYIVENKDDIVSEMSMIDENIRTRKIENLDQNIGLILNNLDTVMEIIKSHNLGFDDFIKYMNEHPESNSSSVNIGKYYNDGIINNADNIYEYVIESLINEDEGFSNIYTTLQLNLYDRYAIGDE